MSYIQAKQTIKELEEENFRLETNATNLISEIHELQDKEVTIKEKVLWVQFACLYRSPGGVNVALQAEYADALLVEYKSRYEA